MRLLLTICLICFSSVTIGQNESLIEENRSNTSIFFSRFKVYQPIYFGLRKSNPYYHEACCDEDLLFSKFQLSFRYQIFDFFHDEELNSTLSFNVQYTQATFWDLESGSQPFFDNQYTGGVFLFYERIGGNNLTWVRRFDIETGYQHDSNGMAGLVNRYVNRFYFQTLFSWRIFNSSHLIVSPKIWLYTEKSSYNKDIEDYWGNGNLELTWRADFGLQIRTWTVLAENGTTFSGHVTFPLNKVWKPLNFYAMASYFHGNGETIHGYDQSFSGWTCGIAFTR